MGQTHVTSRTRSDRSFPTVISQQSHKLRLAELETSQLDNEEPQLGFLCCSRSFSSKKLSHNGWKNHVIAQLERLNLDEWPKMLIDFLKKSDTSELDYVYQSDVTWFDKNYHANNKVKPEYIIPQKILEEHDTSRGYSIISDSRDLFSVNESFTKKQDENKLRSRFLSDDDKKEMDHALKELIDASEIVDEKIYNLGINNNWVEKSFDIKLNKNQTSIGGGSQYFAYNGNGKKGESLLGDVLNKPAAPAGPTANNNNQAKTKTGNKISEAYNNNTVIYQFNIAALGKAINETDILYQPIYNYKSLTSLIDKHLKQEIHVFRKMLNLFEGYFVEKYTALIEDYKKERVSTEIFDEAVIIATYDLQYLITIIYEGLNLYYQLKSLKIGKLPDGETLFDKENVISFLNSIIFNEKIYNLIFELYCLQEPLVEENYQKSLLRYKNCNPEDFSVPISFCLNEKTLEYIKENLVAPPKDVPFVVSDFSASPILNQVDFLHDSENETEKSSSDKGLAVDTQKEKSTQGLEGDIKTGSGLAVPYEKVIQTLNSLPSRRSPIHKLKTILRAMELIGISIQEFYEDAGAQNAKKLDADDTLAVCLYTVARSGLENLNAHCKIIQRFSTAGALSSISGYYASTLEACVNGLCEMEKKHNEGKSEVKKEIRKQSFTPFDMDMDYSKSKAV